MYNPLKPQSAVPDDEDADGDGDGEGEEATLDPWVKRQFFKLVVLLNLGILGTALGAMFLYFRQDYLVAALFGLPGLAVLVYALVDYRRVKKRISERNA
ncbi:DUF7322 domain-containing protein [Halospeciosus flavus]|uniref:DUF7322 domain-containing protein n=1 Tax=Halospeciosus flavus TaxID=3032283 RepID=A0ABD5Z574_9EURY|nr:hypothetical protein [Halospeciosus flavus]